MTTYRAGDIVEVRLDEVDAADLNSRSITRIWMDQKIISHKPAPRMEWWVNVYRSAFGGGYLVENETREEAVLDQMEGRLALWHITANADGSEPKIEVVK